eukprot:649495-Ditylum_brightwellii.AAC.1
MSIPPPERVTIALVEAMEGNDHDAAAVKKKMMLSSPLHFVSIKIPIGLRPPPSNNSGGPPGGPLPPLPPHGAQILVPTNSSI